MQKCILSDTRVASECIIIQWLCNTDAMLIYFIHFKNTATSFSKLAKMQVKYCDDASSMWSGTYIYDRWHIKVFLAVNRSYILIYSAAIGMAEKIQCN